MRFGSAWDFFLGEGRKQQKHVILPSWMCFCLVVNFLRIDSAKGINHHEDFTTTFFWSGKPLVFGSHFSLLHPNIICCHHLSNCCIFWDQVSILLHPRVKGKSRGFFRDPFFPSLRWFFKIIFEVELSLGPLN